MTVLKCTLLLAIAATAWGQRRPQEPPPPPPPPREGMLSAPPGKWWDNPEMAKKLHLTSDQQKKMDDVFQQLRIRLIDLHGTLAKEEATLDPLIQSAQLDDAKILPQIDRIAEARAELEKTESRLLLGFRHVLTPEQWKMLDADRPRPPRDPQAPPPPRREE